MLVNKGNDGIDDAPGSNADNTGRIRREQTGKPTISQTNRCGDTAGTDGGGTVSPSERAVVTYPARSGTPGRQQTADAIEGWYSRHAEVGRVVVVGHDHRGICEFLLDEIVQVWPNQSRIRLAQHGVFEYRGRCRSGPRGRLRLLIPAQDVVHAAIDGRCWFGDRPSYSRDLLPFEKRLLRFL